MAFFRPEIADTGRDEGRCPLSHSIPQTKTLPARPHLVYLKKLAKERLASLRAGRPAARLAHAQLAIAREHGFESWRKLKAHVEQRMLQAAQFTSADQFLLDAFLDASVPRPNAGHKSGSLEPARKMLAEHPEIAQSSIFAACVIGDVKAVGRFLAVDRSPASASGGVRNWPALCYLTFSRFLRDEKKRAGSFVKCAKMLVEAGADANSWWPAPNDPTYRETALYGAAGIANCAPLTKLLLDAGADVNDDEALYHASEFADNAALGVLLEAGPKQELVSYCLCHKMDMEDPDGVKLFIKHGADVNVLLDRGLFKGSRPLHFAIYRRRSLKVFRILLQAGADPNLADKKGATPYQLARKLGLNSVPRLMKSKGAIDDLDPRTQFLAALSSGDRTTVTAMLRRDPKLKDGMSESDYKLLVDAGKSGNVKAVRLMLDIGFPIATRGA